MALPTLERDLRDLFDAVIKELGTEALCAAIQCSGPQCESKSVFEDVAFPPAMLAWAAKDHGVSELDVKFAAEGLWDAVQLAKEEKATAEQIHDQVRRIQGRQPQADQDRADQEWSGLKRAAAGGIAWQPRPTTTHGNHDKYTVPYSRASHVTEKRPYRPKEKIVQRKASDVTEEEKAALPRRKRLKHDDTTQAAMAAKSKKAKDEAKAALKAAKEEKASGKKSKSGAAEATASAQKAASSKKGKAQPKPTKAAKDEEGEKDSSKKAKSGASEAATTKKTASGSKRKAAAAEIEGEEPEKKRAKPTGGKKRKRDNDQDSEEDAPPKKTAKTAPKAPKRGRKSQEEAQGEDAAGCV
ncbi:hypothetical protein C8F04DRAFT_1401555 [Mycena alexandri]|uniref:Uncharacterized protein n=1 Tax=Mycena alexandri TaxID=1745969 RepID=A0AAD6SBP1_9AGAR|nr:hypothetical protein C8F04DRAFT_1401555 [Mycena alexandri]